MRALVAEGATYLSDEFALLSADGRVSPYPRAMTIRTGAGSERITPPSAAVVDAKPIRVKLVALLRHSEDGWSAQQTPPANAILSLVENSVNVRRDPAAALRAMSAMVAGARCIAGTRGEAAEAARLIRAAISAQ